MTPRTALTSIRVLALFTITSGAWPPVLDPRRVNRPPTAFALEPLQWGAVEPRGWLRTWALALSKGAASPTCAAFATLAVPDRKHPNVTHSVDGWKKGRPSFGGFWDEDSAYWIDGMTRLGLILHDPTLLARVKLDFDHTIKNPWNFHNTFPGDAVEGWVRSIYSRAMLAYYDGTGDERIIPFFAKAFANYSAYNSTFKSDEAHQGSRSLTQMEALLETHAFGGPDQLRDVALAMTTDASRNNASEFLSGLLAPGCDVLNGGNATKSIKLGGCGQHTHGVTYNEVAKMYALGAPWESNAERRATLMRGSLNAFEIVERFDMQVHGVNSADEDLNGIAPGVPTETCDVSDYIYSTSWLLRIAGNATYGDRLERAFYNAAGGAVNRTFSGHVYFQSPNFAQNQTINKHLDPTRWADAYWHKPPCCTGNQARMLPNFVAAMWFGGSNDSLYATAYGPSRVNVTTMNGAHLSIDEVTDYPFENAITFRIAIAAASRLSAATASFALHLKVPSWLVATAGGGDLVAAMMPMLNGVALSPLPLLASRGFFAIDREWNDGDVLELTPAMPIRTQRGTTLNNGWNSTAPYNTNGGGEKRNLRHRRHHHHHHEEEESGALSLSAGHMNVTGDLPFCSIHIGPLLFALPLEDTAAAHNYAVQCDASTMSKAPLPSTPAPPGAPFDWPIADARLRVIVRARKFDWENVWELPAKNVSVSAGDEAGMEETISLVPYGQAKIFHISMFPECE